MVMPESFNDLAGHESTRHPAGTLFSLHTMSTTTSSCQQLYQYKHKYQHQYQHDYQLQEGICLRRVVYSVALRPRRFCYSST